MRRLLPGLLLLGPALASAQQWTPTRVGAFDWVCETDPGGVLVSGHQRQDLAFASCTAAKLANPGTDYRVRGGTYRITVAAAPTAPAPAPAELLALKFNACPLPPLVVKIGTPLAVPLGPCFSGEAMPVATWAVFSTSGANAYASGWRVSAEGVLSHPGTGPTSAGVLEVKVSSPVGSVSVSPQPWRVEQ